MKKKKNCLRNYRPKLSTKEYKGRRKTTLRYEVHRTTVEVTYEYLFNLNFVFYTVELLNTFVKTGTSRDSHGVTGVPMDPVSNFW